MITFLVVLMFDIMKRRGLYTNKFHSLRLIKWW